jgi:hypothetical protein
LRDDTFFIFFAFTFLVNYLEHTRVCPSIVGPVLPSQIKVRPSSSLCHSWISAKTLRRPHVLRNTLLVPPS